QTCFANGEQSVKVVTVHRTAKAIEVNRRYHFGLAVTPQGVWRLVEIDWRSDTDSSIKLGEALAIIILQDRALTYHEKFTVSFTRIDGTIATITNHEYHRPIKPGR